MKKVLTGLAIVALAAVANATTSRVAQADPPAGKWEDVCCGATCPGGIDYCLGTGTFVCCKE